MTAFKAVLVERCKKHMVGTKIKNVLYGIAKKNLNIKQRSIKFMMRKSHFNKYTPD